jgi:hypothetical protein
MKPEHLDWLPAIWKRLNQVTDQVLAQPSAEGMAATGLGD